MAYKSEQRSEIRKPVSGLFTGTKNPYQLMLFLGLGGSSVLFLMLAVIYSILKDSSRWVNFHLPGIFWFSTAIIVLSSLTLHVARQALERDAFLTYKILLVVVLILGIGFGLSQFMGWQGMIQKGILMDTSTAGAFLYIISGLHLIHVGVGVILLALLLIQAVKRTTYIDSFIYSVNPPNQLRIRLIMQYWHFVDILWIGLFLFFLYHHYI